MKEKIEIETRKYKSADGTKEFDASFDGLVYTNATEQYQIFGKDQTAFTHYKQRTLIPYAEKLIELGKISTCQSVMSTGNQIVTVDSLIIVRRGGRQHLQGTWLHPKLAIEFGRWLDLEFGIWCNDVIEDLLTFGVVTLREEDKKWVNFVDGLGDREPGSVKQMSDAREALLIHEAQGYNIKAFTDVLDALMKGTHKDVRPKVFKKLRKLIKDMYEDGELSRTSHELMLEYCVDTVVNVLEKEVRRKDRIIAKFEIGTPAPAIVTVEVVPEVITSLISIPAMTIAQKAENDKALRDSNAVISAPSIAAHRIFGLSNVKPDGIPIFEYGRKRPVRDAKALMDEAGLKVSYIRTMEDWKFRLDKKPGSPRYFCVDPSTNVGVNIYDYGIPDMLSCSVWKSRGTRGSYKYEELLDIELKTDTSGDTSFYRGKNVEETIVVSFSTSYLTIMVYGYSSDTK